MSEQQAYLVLRAKVSDGGDEAIQFASRDLEQQIESAKSDGYRPVGGLVACSRPHTFGVTTWLMQAMWLVDRAAVIS